MCAIGIEIHRFLSDSAAHRGFRDGRGFPHQHSRIKWLRDQILASKLQAGHAIGAADRVGDIFLRQVCQRARGGQFHLFVDSSRAHIKRSAENKWESENIVDLVGIIGTTGGNDHVWTARLGFLVGDFRIRIRHGEDNRIGRHGSDHVTVDRAFDRKSGKHISPDHRFGERAHFGFLREALFVFVHSFFAALVHHALGVAEDDVLLLHTQPNVLSGASNARSSSADDDNVGLLSRRQ